MIKNLLFIGFSVAVGYGLAILISQGLDRDIVVQCNKLASQSRVYADTGFYLTKSEKTMCDGVGISIVAPVK